jgi:oligopeptide/dipeptide ABC transporter ATP-binding protein
MTDALPPNERVRTLNPERQAPPLLDVVDLRVRFPRSGGDDLVAVDQVSFKIQAGEVVSIVGESGSGKSVTARALMGLLPKGWARVTGRVRYDGLELTTLPEPRRRCLLGEEMGMVFQEPGASFSPTRTITAHLEEILQVRAGLDREQAAARSLEALRAAGVPEPVRVGQRYVWELSGGLAQRAGIAAALLLSPRLVFADEPTTALDVTTQAALTRSLVEQTRQDDMALVFITHDLSLARLLPGRVLVFYAGCLVESGPAAEVLAEPSHPYTAALMACVPGRAVDLGVPLAPLPGRLPRPGEAAGRCPFMARCRFAEEVCTRRPAMKGIGKDRQTACHLPLGVGGDA